jgi:DNA-binding transcriptional LysR family regulator
MRPIDLSKLRLVYEIAREENMTRAADKLNLTQSALSKALITLEDQIGTKLFDRVSTGMRLTPQGERLYLFAENMLQQASSFERVFYEKEDEAEGEIKIITTPFVGAVWLAPNLPGFLEKYPKIKIKVLLRSDNIDISEGDVAICLFRPHQPELIQELLFTTYIRLFASPLYLKKFGKPGKPEDLDNHFLITYRGNYYSSYGSTN